MLQLHPEELEAVVEQSGLDAETVHEKFAQFCMITEGKPSKVTILLNKTHPSHFLWYLLASPAGVGVQGGSAPLLRS